MPARDDPDDVPVLVEERRGLPRDDALLAACVREGVLVLRRRESRRSLPEAPDHLVSLVRVDEDLPEVASLDPASLLEPARDLDGPVEVADASLGVHDREEARRRVDDGLEEAVLRADLRLQPLLLEGERGRRRDRVDEAALVGERPVVDERGDALAAVLHERRGPCASRDGVGELTSLLVDPCLVLRRPVRELERRVAERVGERVSQWLAVPERDRQVCDARTREPRSQDSGEERERHQGERDERHVLEPQGGRLAERADDAARHERRERLEREEVDGADDPAERRARGAIPRRTSRTNSADATAAASSA